MTSRRFGFALALLPAMGIFPAQLAQTTKEAHKPMQAQASSIVTYGSKEGAETVEVRNVTFEVTGNRVPGRPPDERLMLRKTMRSKQVLDEIGVEATSTLEAWPLGVDLRQKPLYNITLTGVDGLVMDGALWVAARGVEEVDWWSVHKLGTGQHLFDTYVPVLRFSISRETQTLRYTGLEVPPDDIADARLREAHVVAVLSYASAERVIRETLLTCDDPKQVQALRSYADGAREVSLVEAPRAIKISFSRSYPSAPATVSVLIPILRDDLDLAHAQLPPRLHVAAWRR